MIFVAEGNSSDAVHKFREYLEEHGGSAENIRHVSMDMGGGYRKGTAECFPDAKVTFDRFHVVKHMTEAVNEVRRREYAGLMKEEAEDREALKGKRYLLLKNNINLTDSEKEDVKSLISRFKDPGKTYIQKETLRGVWGMEKKYDAVMYPSDG